MDNLLSANPNATSFELSPGSDFHTHFVSIAKLNFMFDVIHNKQARITHFGPLLERGLWNPASDEGAAKQPHHAVHCVSAVEAIATICRMAIMHQCSFHERIPIEHKSPLILQMLMASPAWGHASTDNSLQHTHAQTHNVDKFTKYHHMSLVTPSRRVIPHAFRILPSAGTPALAIVGLAELWEPNRYDEVLPEYVFLT